MRQPRDTFKNRLFKVLLITYLVTSLSIAAAQILNGYYNGKQQIAKDIQSLWLTLEHGLVSAIWEFEDEQIDSILYGIQQQPYVAGVQVFNSNDQLIRSAGWIRDESNDLHFREVAGMEPLPYKKNAINTEVYEFAIQHPSESLGRLVIYDDQSIVTDRVLSESIQALLTALAHIIVLGVMLAFFTRRIIDRPLLQFSDEINNVDFDKAADLQLSNVEKESYEIKSLYFAFKNMLANIVISKHELQKLNEDLESKVQQRTEELLLAKEYAESANIAKSRFLANMSHELRTPLNAVLGFSDIMRQKEQNKENKQYLDSINYAGHALLKLINDVLDISKIDAEKINLEGEPVALADLRKEIVAIFQTQANAKDLEFVFHLADNLPAALVTDRMRLSQILINLCDNAIKFTKAGHVRVAVSASLSGGKADLTIEVSDTGKGISATDQKSIFNPFEQAEDQKPDDYGGTGLGLSITKRIVEIMGGWIQVKSELNKGSVFTVCLPEIEVAQCDVQSQEEVVPLNFNTIRFCPAKVLIVDDVQNNRDVLLGYLGNWDFDLAQAINGQEALEQVAENKPDLVIMDIKMPVMDGLEACKRLKANIDTKDIPILVITASVQQEDQSGIRQYSEGFLRKPFQLDELVRRLMDVLEYQYAAEQPEVSPSRSLRREDLNTLEQGQINTFRKDLLAGNYLAMIEFCDDLLKSDEALAGELRALVSEFDYDTLNELFSAPQGEEV